jgi:hypothetical protein
MTLIIAAAFIAGILIACCFLALEHSKALVSARNDLTTHKLLLSERDQHLSDLTGEIVEAEAEIARLGPLARRGEQAIASQLKASLASAEKRAKAMV